VSQPPALLSLALWIYIFLSAPLAGIVFSIAFLALAVGAYALFARSSAERAHTS
jgi:hypothetical protein